MWNLPEYLWVASQIISLIGDIEFNPSPKSNMLNQCFSIFHWNLKAYQHICLQKFLFYQHTCLSRNLISFSSPKIISIPKSHLMRKFRKYLDTILSRKITHLTVKVVESVFTIKDRSHLE